MVSRRSWYERPRIVLPAVTIKDMAAAAELPWAEQEATVFGGQ